MLNPCARRDGIVREKLASETILYDQSTHRAHCLNETVALVWESADGKRPVDEIASILHDALGIPADREVVLLAMQELGASGLLEVAQPGVKRLTRREVARRLAMAGASAAMVPLVATVLAPTPAMASSGAGVNQQQAGQDLFDVELEALFDPKFFQNQAARNDLTAAQAAFGSDNYAAEIADLDATLKALGLPPLS